MQQLISDIQDFSVIKHKDKNWVKLSTSNNVNTRKSAIVADVYLEIPNDTPVEVVATPEQTAKYFLTFNK